jgi:hypothetical protein
MESVIVAMGFRNVRENLAWLVTKTCPEYSAYNELDRKEQEKVEYKGNSGRQWKATQRSNIKL